MSPIKWVPWGLFLVKTKQPDRDADLSPALSAEVKKECGCFMKVSRFLPVCLRSTNKV